VPFATVPLEPECPVETVPLLYAPPAAVVCATSVLLSIADEASEITTTEEASVTGRMVASVMVRIEEEGEASVTGRLEASVMATTDEEGEAEASVIVTGLVS
jgi:hypothetical protein